MKKEQDYIKDISEIRHMMERSSKILSLSGWAGILAGLYALAAAWFAHFKLGFQPNALNYPYVELSQLILLAAAVLIIALITAIFFSWKSAKSKNKNIWNATSRRMLTSMAVPLFTGGALILLLIAESLNGLIAPLTLIFYGLALFNAGHYTIKEVRLVGVVQIILGLLNVVYLDFGLLFWALGFGVMHIVYGIYMYFSFER